MKKLSLLVFSALFLSNTAALAQYDDVTEQYLPYANFEECEALQRTVVQENYGSYNSPLYQNVYVYDLQRSTTPSGTDLTSQGWSLVEQVASANSGVIEYGGEISPNNNKNNYRVQISSWNPAGEPIPQSGPVGSKNTKGLCFVGSPLIYRQAEEITLPRGNYRLTVHIYTENGQSSPKETFGIGWVKTGFMPTGKTDDKDLLPKAAANVNFYSNKWNENVLEFSITEPTKGRFQLCYSNSYPVIVDHMVLECEGGIVTKELKAAVKRAEALNAELNNETLAAAIQSANDFIAVPTSQEDVTTQIQTLAAAMKTALEASTGAVDITAAYIDNASFENGKSAPWTVANGSAAEPTNELSKPYIDGKYVMEFVQTASNSMKLTLTNMPAGYYLMDARLNNNATFKIANVNGTTTGGVEALYIRNAAGPVQVAEGDLSLSIWANNPFRVDDIRLLYAKTDGELLRALNLARIKDGALAILLNDNSFTIVTGEEREELAEALKGTDGAGINELLNAFFKAKDSYERAAKAKEDAAPYNKENYPYATEATLQQIQMLINTAPVTSAQAKEQVTLLTNACKQLIIENAYCDGVYKNDLTNKIAGANAEGTTLNTAWISNNVTIRTLSDNEAWTTRNDTKDNVVYGTTAAYNSSKKDDIASLQQTITGLPAGKYVLSATMAGKKDLPVVIRINNVKKATFKGLDAGVTVSNWMEVVTSFELTDAADVTIRFEEATEVSYKQWFVDNIRLYQLLDGEPEPDGIRTIQSRQRDTQNYFDLSGRRVAQPAKGLYIVDGKKVIIK